ncbi:MAG: hypothetical protein IJR99_15175 [Kiritimatiellae bacterium]|nr:hypothetical protein [Kiritimatiellia bacterium]
MLKTEMRNPKTIHIDRMTTAEMLRVIQEENHNAVKAVDACLDAVAKAVDMATEALRNGGRLIYVGAGTSGGAEYVLAAIEYAKSLGCATVGITLYSSVETSPPLYFLPQRTQRSQR